MRFKTGDPVVHPIRGAGVVERVEERQWHEGSDLYYRIELLGQPGTWVMIPTGTAEKIGLRLAISQAKLEKVWRVLYADPDKLPTDHKARYKLLKKKLYGGDIFEVAEAVRDMTWRREQEGHLTTKGKRMYQKAMMLLTGEVAATQGVDLTEAAVQVRAKLREGLSPISVT